MSAERALAQIRNAVLVHAGYDVIAADSLETALEALSRRSVGAMVVSHTVRFGDLRTLSQEAHRRGVPLIVLDPYDQQPAEKSELHINPLAGPEVFLSAVAALVSKEHPRSLSSP